MTIDEGIERLTERHEALAQSVEATSRDVAALTGHMANMMQAITRPGNTGAIHSL